ncbi:hypothetical protein AVEN_10683-1 [Araneus ventricosus]|uniref:Uncharacterized protein n=1 Tax=Araneus ventricosus TaxID=182803 RepID=A0A4Y2ET31_ARAVE|nr:hypothetical protein AVEN_10683-1 [Araneus ventricosus]
MGVTNPTQNGIPRRMRHRSWVRDISLSLIEKCNVAANVFPSETCADESDSENVPREHFSSSLPIEIVSSARAPLEGKRKEYLSLDPFFCCSCGLKCNEIGD